MLLFCRHMAKLCSYILYKNISLRNVSKLPHGMVYKTSQWRFIKYLKSHISNIGANIFLFIWKKNSLVERIYQLRNFDTNFIGCHLICLILQTLHATKSKIFFSLLVGMQHDIAYEISEKVSSGFLHLLLLNCYYCYW